MLAESLKYCFFKTGKNFNEKINKMKKLNFILVFVLIVNALFSQSKDELAIRNLLNEQTIAWNRGDIEGFMKGYWQNDSLMFIGKSGVTYGWQNTLNNYKKGYPDTAAMGKLNFELIQVKRLSAIYFYIVGKWHLQRTIGDVQGHFNLLFRKVKNQWVIIADHSS
jgi:ketosteroid isomerase-like protein